MEFVRSSNVYSVYYPMLVFMIGTAVRCGEAIGLTWNGVDFANKTVTIEHQLIKFWRTDVEIDGYSDFVFSTKNKNPIMPSAVNNILLNIVNKHNSVSDTELPHISAIFLDIQAVQECQRQELTRKYYNT